MSSLDVPADPPATWGPPHTKTSTWYSPFHHRPQAAGMPGLDYLQGIVDGHFPPPPIASITDSRLVSVADGEAVFRCAPDESFLNPLGLVHGGLLCTLMDSAMGVAVQTRCPIGVGYASIELKVSFLAPLPWDGETEVEVRGRALRVGRRIAFAESHAYDPAGRLIGHSTSSLVAVEGAT